MSTVSAPGYTERLFIVGKNGTGKSELTYALEAAGGYRQSIYFDVKGDCMPHPPFALIRRGDDWRGWDARRIVYRPEPGTPWRTDSGWAQVLNRVAMQSAKSYDHKRRRSRKPVLVIIPEILLFGPKAQKVIADMASGWRQYELGLWIESQRPRRIPVVIRSEAWRWYVFPLGYEDDELEVLKSAKGRLSVDAFRQLEDSVTPEDPHPFYELILRSRESAALQVSRCGSLSDQARGLAPR